MSWSPTPDEAASVGRFDRAAAQIDTHYERETGPGHLFRARVDGAVRLLGDGPGRLLDAGMGPGGLLRAIDRSAWIVWGVDAAPRMVELARARLPDVAERLSVARIEQLPFPEHSFEAVSALGVIEYVDAPSAVAELARVLVPGGVAALSFRSRSPRQRWRSEVVRPAARTWFRATGGSGPQRRRPLASEEELERLLAAAGLSIETIESVACSALPDPVDRLFPELERRLARRAESAGPRVRSVLALHVLLRARKSPVVGRFACKEPGGRLRPHTAQS